MFQGASRGNRSQAPLDISLNHTRKIKSLMHLSHSQKFPNSLLKWWNLWTTNHQAMWGLERSTPLYFNGNTVNSIRFVCVSLHLDAAIQQQLFFLRHVPDVVQFIVITWWRKAIRVAPVEVMHDSLCIASQLCCLDIQFCCFDATLSIAPWKFLIWLISVKESRHLCCG